MTTEIGDTRNFIKASKKMYAESKGLNTVILYNGEAAGIVGYNEVDWQNKTPISAIARARLSRKRH